MLEVVFVLGMIALLAAIISSLNLDSMMNNNGAKPAFEVFREATHEARIQSINRAEVLFLSFDQESQKFLLTSSNDAAEESINEGSLPEFNRYGYLTEPEEPVEEAAEEEGRREFPVFEEELEVEFRGLRAADASGLSSASADYTQEPLPHLVFHPGGVSSPAVAILRYSNGEELVLTMDKFANGPELSVDSGVRY